MGPSRRQALPWVLALGGVLALAILWLLVQGSPPRPRQPARREATPHSTVAKPPGLEFRSTRLKVMDPQKGRVAWEVTLAQAEAAAESGEVWLDGIEAAYYNPDGTVTRLSARKGHLEPGGRALVFTGEVRLSAPGGGELLAETLRWEAGREEFRATGPPGGQAVFTRGTTVLRAAELQGDLALKRVRATGGVRLRGMWG